VIWQTYTIDEKPHPYRKSKAGTQFYGPAGGAVWNSPTVDPVRQAVYFGTGDAIGQTAVLGLAVLTPAVLLIVSGRATMTSSGYEPSNVNPRSVRP